MSRRSALVAVVVLLVLLPGCSPSSRAGLKIDAEAWHADDAPPIPNPNSPLVPEAEAQQ